MPIETINGLKMYYEQQGKGEDVVFIGGLTTNRSIWLDCLPQFTNHYRVTLFDNRGAGQTEVPSQSYTINTMSEDVIALFDHLNIQRAHVIGHSMGGMILQQLMLDHPDRLSSAIICSSAMKLPINSVIGVQTANHLKSIKVPDNLVLETFIPWLFGPTFLSKNPIDQLIKNMMMDPYPQTYEGYRGQAYALEQFDVRDKKYHANVKTLIVVGEEDILMPPTCAKALAEKIPGAKIKFIKQAAHMLHLENKNAFVEAILKFMGG